MVIAGLVGDFVNTLAGNGSAFTLPALEFAGWSNDVANGTNHLSIIAFAKVWMFRFLVLVVVLAIVHLITVDTERFLL